MLAGAVPAAGPVLARTSGDPADARAVQPAGLADVPLLPALAILVGLAARLGDAPPQERARPRRPTPTAVRRPSEVAA